MRVLIVLVFTSLSFEVLAETVIYNANGTIGQTADETKINRVRAKDAYDPVKSMLLRVSEGGVPLKKNCKSHKISEGTLKACEYSLVDGGASSTFYELNGEPYDGLVVYLNGRFKLIPKNGIAPKDEAAQVPCGNPQRRTKYTSLVCNCFHEARGQSFAEQVSANRTVFSRVLSPAFPDSVGDVVYARNAYQWTRLNVKGNPNLALRDIILDEDSEEFKKYFPGETNSLRSCKKSSVESLRYENEFFAVAYVVKGQEDDYHRTCEKFAAEVPHVAERNRLLNTDPDLAHRFFSVCESREERCVLYTDCDPAPKKSLRPRMRKAKPLN